MSGVDEAAVSLSSVLTLRLFALTLLMAVLPLLPHRVQAELLEGRCVE